MAKGQDYEREICVNLSLWWTGGENEDMLWRTAGSGARARTRSKTGRKTANHHGDITATHSDAMPLIKVFSIEIKRGYNKINMMDLLDKTEAAKQIELEVWIQKQVESMKESDSHSWLIIHRHDRRHAMIYMPKSTLSDLLLTTGNVPYPHAFFRVPVKNVFGKKQKMIMMKILVMRFEDWKKMIEPKEIIELSKRAIKR